VRRETLTGAAMWVSAYCRVAMGVTMAYTLIVMI
jgi:hypothetical protein